MESIRGLSPIRSTRFVDRFALLWMNWQQRKENKEDEIRSAEALKYHQENIAGKLDELGAKLELTGQKIDTGLTTMRESTEDRVDARIAQKSRLRAF